MDLDQLHTLLDDETNNNPTGAWTEAPSLAATTVPMVNTSGSTVWVDVIGGTVTEIDVNGVSTGITAGSVRLLNGDSLAITYSGAPTLGWYYEAAAPVKPSGAWSGAPSVAATTVAMVNTSGYNVIAYINANGATITVIKRNGITTGLLVGAVRLRRGESLSITYTAATPAIVWLYE